MSNQTVVCKRCRWTHFAVTRQHALEQVVKFNEHYYSLEPEEQVNFAGPVTMGEYESCYRCDGTEFEPGNTAPTGSTIGPIIYEEET